MQKKRLQLIGMAFLTIILLASAPAFSQSCSLCYTQAASSGARMIQVLRGGILILIAPPYRHDHRHDLRLLSQTQSNPED